jgi:hypothetical protein
MLKLKTFLLTLLLGMLALVVFSQKYQNFKVFICCRAQEVVTMADTDIS